MAGVIWVGWNISRQINQYAEMQTSWETLSAQMAGVCTEVATTSENIDSLCGQNSSDQQMACGVLETQQENLVATCQTMTSSLSTDGSLSNVSPMLLMGLGGGALLSLLLSMVSPSKPTPVSSPRKRNPYDDGWADGVHHVVNKVLIADSGVLQNAVIWLDNNRRNQADLKSAERIFNQLIARMQRILKVTPVGKINESVKYDPRSHRVQQTGIQPGDRVRIIENGWVMGDEIIQKPLVGR